MHVGWSTDTHGSRNCHDGEYDSSMYFLLVAGIPVYWSFRGCVHVINLQKISSRERLDRVRKFANRYLVAPWMAGELRFPLRPLGRLKRLIWYDMGLMASGISAFIAVVAIWAISLRPFNRWTQGDIIMVGLLCALGAPFIPGGIAYWITRKPSQRQKRIRSVVANRLGPFSDPADWTPQVIALVAQDLGIKSAKAETLLQEGEQRMKRKQYEDALLTARMGLAITESSPEPGFPTEEQERAERITDEVLLHLGDAGSALG
jgi:hypothetical protein